MLAFEFLKSNKQRTTNNPVLKIQTLYVGLPKFHFKSGYTTIANSQIPNLAIFLLAINRTIKMKDATDSTISGKYNSSISKYEYEFSFPKL